MKKKSIRGPKKKRVSQTEKRQNEILDKLAPKQNRVIIIAGLTIVVKNRNTSFILFGWRTAQSTFRSLLSYQQRPQFYPANPKNSEGAYVVLHMFKTFSIFWFKWDFKPSYETIDINLNGIEIDKRD